MKKLISAVLCMLSLFCLASCADKVNVLHDFSLGESYNKAKTTLVENDVKFKEHESMLNKEFSEDSVGQFSSFDMSFMDQIEFVTSLNGSPCQVSLCFFEGRLARICMDCSGKKFSADENAELVRKELEARFAGRRFVSDESDESKVLRMKLSEQHEIELSSSGETMSCVVRDKVLNGKILAIQEQAKAGYLQGRH